jgi:dihydrofolate reductase
VDAFWLKIFPVTLGSGKRLFADGTMPAVFKVTESTVTSKGVILVNYERIRRQTGFWELGLMPNS